MFINYRLSSPLDELVMNRMCDRWLGSLENGDSKTLLLSPFIRNIVYLYYTHPTLGKATEGYFAVSPSL